MDEMSQNNIYPKTCTYGCGLQIYWNTSVNEYWEVLAQKKHICPSRPATTTRQATTSTGSTYYNKKPWSPKPKMSTSFELLQGSILQVQKQYEVLSDIVIDTGGKVHGSQRDRDTRTGLLDLLVYYEVPEGKRDEVKRKFEFIKNKPSSSTNAAGTYIPSGSSVAA
jgi:hypothetical protein